MKLLIEYSYYTAIYADGSKDNDRVGYGLVINNLSINQRLPSNASILTAEVTAIDLALDTIADSDDDHFIIFSDSLSVLLSLHNKKMNNLLILQLLEKLHYSALVKLFISVGFLVISAFVETRLLIWLLRNL